jgi:cardiolipin synthase
MLWKSNRVSQVALAIAIAFFSVWSYAFTAPKDSFLNQLEPLSDAELISTPEQDHTKIIKAFDAAKKSIQIGIYGISDENIVNSLISAEKRNVDVTIICDAYCEGTPKKAAYIASLKKAGVEVIRASLGFRISHWKTFIIDESTAFISTMNFIERTSQMRDFGIFLTNKSIVQEILSVFKTDIQNAKTNLATSPALSQPNLVWSPVNSSAKLIQLINASENSVEIWIENMGSTEFQTSLIAAAKRKVQVRILTSICAMGGANDSFTNLNQLASQGILIQGMPFPATSPAPYIHAKTINVDHQVIFLGSENFSNSSLQYSRELGLIFHDDSVQKKMADLFESDWQHSVQLPVVAPPNCSAL